MITCDIPDRMISLPPAQVVTADHMHPLVDDDSHMLGLDKTEKIFWVYIQPPTIGGCGWDGPSLVLIRHD